MRQSNARWEHVGIPVDTGIDGATWCHRIARFELFGGELAAADDSKSKPGTKGVLEKNYAREYKFAVNLLLCRGN